MDEVLQLMLAVASFDPSDADVQVVLGVLQNVTQDLTAAAVAFQQALKHNPQDFSLLNKVSELHSHNCVFVVVIQYQPSIAIMPPT